MRLKEAAALNSQPPEVLLKVEQVKDCPGTAVCARRLSTQYLFRRSDR